MKHKRIHSISKTLLAISISASMTIGTSNINIFAAYQPETIKPSPDKYTYYVNDYIGKNLANFGYTSLDGNRRDSYGPDNIILRFVTEDGTYIDPEDEEGLKQYVVIGQNTKPNSEIKFTYQKDSDGNEYDNLIEYCNYDELVLKVQKAGTGEIIKDDTLTEIKPSVDKYTYYIKDYVGRNLADCGYISMGGELLSEYGAAHISIIPSANDGSYVDINDEAMLDDYVVVSQSVAPNTEFKVTYSTDSNGEEYSNLIDSQGYEEIQVTVTNVENYEPVDKNTQASADAEQIINDSNDTQSDTSASTDVTPEFKEAMDAYEKFFNGYAEFMKKYDNSSDQESLSTEYWSWLGQYTDVMGKLGAINKDELSESDLAYYSEVYTRIAFKIAEINQ